MTLMEIASGINALFDRYGLAHSVVTVKETLPIRLDPRETEPNPMMWRRASNDALTTECLVLEGCDDPDRMDLLLTTLTHIFDVYFEVEEPKDQRRLF
jgi:hypothetical protein